MVNSIDLKNTIRVRLDKPTKIHLGLHIFVPKSTFLNFPVMLSFPMYTVHLTLIPTDKNSQTL